MWIVKWLKDIIDIDYGTLSNGDRQLVYSTFIDECLGRLRWVATIAFIGEIILTFLDFVSGFFFANPINYLNFLSEVILISSSFMVVYLSKDLVKEPFININEKRYLIISYKVFVFVSVLLFIFTDIYVRHVPLGAYIIYFFVFQIAPFYGPLKNMVLFGIYGVFVELLYVFYVPGISDGSLFSVLSIYFAFAFSTECLRSYFIKKLVNDRKDKLMTKRFSNLAIQTILALSDAVEAKDIYTKGHSQRVAKYSKEIAQRMGYDDQQMNEVYYIGLLHDIGKIGVHDSVINKPGRLTDEEFNEIKRHPVMGYDILKNITEIPDVSIGAKWHHEKYNGTGYPDGLSGEEIPLIARIIAVADAYDAMTSNRSYRDLLPQSKVRSEIEKNMGIQFDPSIAKIMLDMIDEDIHYTMHE